MDPRLLAFIGVAALLTVSPGPDMALVLRNAVASGRASVLPTTLGICGGLLVWGAASAIGLAAILAASAQLYDAVRLAGAAYLVALGLWTLAAMLRRGEAREAAPRAPRSARSAFAQGLFSNLLNPKVGVFYVTFLPQFIAPGQPVIAATLLLATIHASMGLAWLTAYGRAASRLGDFLRGGRVRKAVETATGGVLIAFGLAVAVERR